MQLCHIRAGPLMLGMQPPGQLCKYVPVCELTARTTDTGTDTAFSLGLLISCPSVLLSLRLVLLFGELTWFRELEMNPAAGANSCLLQPSEQDFF